MERLPDAYRHNCGATRWPRALSAWSVTSQPMPVATAAQATRPTTILNRLGIHNSPRLAPVDTTTVPVGLFAVEPDFLGPYQ